MQAGLDGAIAALSSKAVDEFSRTVIQCAERALEDAGNPLRLNFFATAMRILFEHVFEVLSPDAKIVECAWFVAERSNGKPSRSQRIAFAIQGGLSNKFVTDDLKVDSSPLKSRILKTIDRLSRHIHGRQETVVADPTTQDKEATAALSAMNDFLDAITACRRAIVDPIIAGLDSAAVDALISETILEIDELATHHSLDEVYVDHIGVHEIGPHAITYRAKGTVEVTLQFGSNSDVRRGDGAEIPHSFPFHCDIEVPIDDPHDVSMGEPAYGVDKSRWRDAMAQDPDDY